MREFEVVSPRARLVRILLGSWAVVIYIFLFAPILTLVLFSFNANQYGTFPFTGWTMHWYGQVFHDYQIKDALFTTLRISAEVTAIATFVGTAAAFPLVRSRLPFRSGIRIGMKTKMTAVVMPGRICGSRMRVIAVLGVAPRSIAALN